VNDLASALLLIALVLAGIFMLPFAMAWLEPKQTPAHRAATSRRPATRRASS
jgi:hypothetical protein